MFEHPSDRQTELIEIARPRVFLYRREERRIERGNRSRLSRRFGLQKLMREQRNILRALAQRGNLEPQRTKVREQLTVKGSRAHQGAKIHARRGDDCNTPVPPQSQKPHHHLLAGGGEAIDVGEEEGATGGVAEEGARVAELAVRVDGADAEERGSGEGREVVQGLRDGVGTAARFAVEQGDAEVGSEQAQLGPEASHRRAGADEALSISTLLGRSLYADGTERCDGERLGR